MEQTAPPPPPPPPPPPSGAFTAELPRALPELPATSYTDTIRVAVGGDLQAAINAATSGTAIVLDPSGTWMGPYSLPNRGDNGWVQIVGDVAFAAGQRVVSTLTLPVITAPQGPNWTMVSNQGGGGWHLRLLELTNESAPFVNAPLYLHGGPVPDRVLVDQVVIRTKGLREFTRCILGNAGNLTVRYSQLIGCKRTGQQPQGVAVWNSPGPIHIHDNLIQGAAQGILLGGAGGVEFHPHDITIERNHLQTPAAWQGVYHNLAPIEFKDAHRALIEGNVIEGGEFGLLLKSTDQNGACGPPDPASDNPGCGTEDVTIRNNHMFDLRLGGVNLQRISGGTAGFGLRRIVFQNNVIEDIGTSSNGWVGNSGSHGKAFQILQAPEDVSITGLTIRSATMNSWINWSSPRTSPETASFTLDNVKVEGTPSFGAHISPGPTSAYWATPTLGTVYGSCNAGLLFTQTPGITCVTTVPSGVGADEAAIAAATVGVIR